jgi:hypothetical protein
MTGEICIVKTLTLGQQLQAAKASLFEHEVNEPDSGLVEPLIGQGFERPMALALLTGNKWRPGRVLTVSWLEDNPHVYDESLRRDILNFFKRWGDYGEIDFKGVGLGTHGDIRVSLAQTGQSWSYLGTDIFAIPKDQPTMQLGWVTRETPIDVVRRVALHEAGHTCGFGHEHQHKDAVIPYNRDAVYSYYMGPPNNWPKDQVDLQVLNPMRGDHIGGYDRSSIMHYPVPGFLLTDPSKAIGLNDKLSEQDKIQVAKFY